MNIFRRQRKLESLPRAESEGLMLDMGDAIIVSSLMLKFAGFTWADGALFLVVMAIAGNGQEEVSLYDSEIADIANCTERTVRRWRKGYSEKARGIVGAAPGTKRYSPMDIREGEYDPKTQRYQPTTYHVSIVSVIDRAVAVARALKEYKTDRLLALKKSAELHYKGIPDAPYLERRKKPSRSLKAAVPALIANARKNIDRASIAFDDLNEFAREDLMEIQGQGLRDELLNILDRIAKLLESFPQPIENKQSKGGIGHIVRYPPDSWDRYVSFLMNSNKKGLRIISDSAPQMSPAEVKWCRNELRSMSMELASDPELWEVYLFEATELESSGRLPKHRSSKECAYLLSCSGDGNE
jgi:hypothetical protein